MFGTDILNSILPDDSASAVVSQLDRFSSEIRNVLRVASVAGQFFRFIELQWVLSKLYPEAYDLFTDRSLRHILQKSIAGGLISTESSVNASAAEPNGVFFFSHYLLYQGVYQSLLSARREEIHEKYADYYEQELHSNNNTAQALTTLTYHLLKIPGQVERKIVFVRQAFLMFAERRRHVEGLMFYDVLNALRSEQEIAETPMERAKELRLVGLLLFEQGDKVAGFDMAYSAFDALGMPLRKYRNHSATMVQMFASVFFLGIRLSKVHGKERLLLSARCVKRRFPTAASNVNLKTLKSFLSERAVIPDPTNDVSSIVQELAKIGTEIDETIRSLMEMLFITGQPTLEFAYAMCLRIPVAACIMDPAAVRLTGAFATLAIQLLNMGLVREGRRLANASLKTISDKIASSPAPSDTLGRFMYSGGSLVSHTYGEWDLFVAQDNARHENARLLGLAKMTDSHKFRVNRIIIFTMTGRIPAIIDELHEDLVNVYKDPNSYEAFIIQMSLLSLQCYVGDSEKAFEAFDSVFNIALRVSEGARANAYDTTWLGTLLLNISLSALWANQPDDPCWLEKSFKSLALIATGISRLIGVQKLFAPAVFLVLLPHLLDFFLLLSQEARPVRPILAVLDAITAATRQGCRAHPSTHRVFTGVLTAMRLLARRQHDRALQCFGTIVATGNHRFTTLPEFTRIRIAVRVVAIAGSVGIAPGSVGVDPGGIEKALEVAGCASELAYLRKRAAAGWG
ncbi:hypothetical protein HDU96_002996 [Phlyctochytrium bullatum]|nr:hypothetical protein HDU96_002996 [Phlyctochytrium bullatum]